MRFIADDMLGRLARWLRILGYDVRYHRGISDDELLRVGVAERRIVLTRDTGVAARWRPGEGVFVRSGLLDEQLTQLATELKLDLSGNLLTRCLICNRVVERVSKEEVTARVPSYVLRIHSTFYRCPECGRIYWTGSHYDRIVTRLERIRTQTGKMSNDKAQRSNTTYGNVK